MKVILLEDVKKVGKKGEIVTVADGYGQNFLIKNQKAVMANAHERKILAKQNEEKAKELELEKQNAIELSKRLETIILKFVSPVGKDGLATSQVSTKQIVKELREKYDIRVDKRKFVNPHSIGAFGDTKMEIELFKGVMASINIHLSPKQR